MSSPWRTRAVVTGGLLIALSSLLAGVACRGPEPAPPPPTPSPDTVRTLAQGQVIGFEDRFDSHVWRGIPYAQPPVGALRWRAPRPPEPWDGTREALTQGRSCPQFAGPGGGPHGEERGEPMGDEDCLYVNVFAPRFTPDAVPTGDRRLPVMVWIHGGGNTIGDSRPYHGGRLASRHDVVVFTINYRLGVFGWFTHPALRGPQDDAWDRSGNWGTLDLIRALQWVRENASAFGGNPDNVTIFGESAGGTNVYSLLVSRPARGLFQRAIVESGGLRTTPRAEAENLVDAKVPGDASSSSEVLLRLFLQDGAVDRAAAKVELASMKPPEIAAYLRGKSSREILGVFGRNERLGGMYRVPTLIRDGAVLPEGDPHDVLADPDGTAPVPTILGTNRDENKLFLLFGSDNVRHLFGLPLWLADERAYDLEAEYQSLAWKASGVDGPAAAMHAARPAPVFAYRFDWDEEPTVLWADFSKMLGASHALEIPFVFGTFDLGRGNRFLWDEARIPERDALSDAMMSYWTSFAYTGDPGRGRSGTLVPWTAWDATRASAPKFLVFDTPADGGIRMSSNTITNERLLAKLAGDDRFEDLRERCQVLYELVTWGRGISEDEYAVFSDGACRAFPLDAFPWN